MNENNTKTVKSKKFKPNIIDFLIVVVVLGAIVGIILRAGIIEKAAINSSLEKVQISFLIQDINDESENYFNKGDRFYSRTHTCDLGKLETVIPRAAEAFIVDEYGMPIKTESNNHRIDIIGTVIGEGVFTDEGFLLEGVNYIAPGSYILFDSPNVVGGLTVTDIQRISNAE